MSDSCGCKGGREVADILTGGHADAVPSPRTAPLRTGGGERCADDQPARMGGTARSGGNALAIAAIAAVVILIIVAIRRKVKSRTSLRSGERFFTQYAQEEPTRPYTPYTGTVPFGEWGTKPWAYAYDMETPQEAYPYLPPPYRTFMDVL